MHRVVVESRERKVVETNIDRDLKFEAPWYIIESSKLYEISGIMEYVIMRI